MAYEIIWSARSRADLEEINAYISKDNAAAAKRTVQGIVDRVAKLSRLPRMGKRYARVTFRDVRQLVSGKYRVFYFVNADEKRIEILRVWHGARQEPPLSNGLE
jgi:addiction module RelE/StbE family toxin